MVTVSAAKRRNPPFGGSLAYLLLNLPLGILAITLITVLSSAGLGTAVVWLGLPLLGLLVLLARGGGRLERARVFALLDTYIDSPYLPLPPSGQRARWVTRVKDGATWRDLAYFVLLFPAALVEFVLVVTFWAVSLALVALPIYYRFLPEGAWFFPGYDVRWFTVDTTVAALPWAALGVLFAALSVALTRGLAAVHGGLAVALLRPTVSQRRRMERSWQEIDGMSAVTG
ncbi:sensor domain-containing protein [Amycolatopsis sp. FDAARGOS 1241]|uniref:sensor domain-containing protein n=1 Tax=Amycolatopsis sp. FDAARGOS 1241 TaxID=2778070 RepID=UPI00194E3699|nr:sensor domain-containing protein [Amycolatopsis sp. FDAARGOS 1241]QRP44922.1 sensor domain-containing protein [Amycolatopsis sp. FDAARGOS 1241]